MCAAEVSEEAGLGKTTTVLSPLLTPRIGLFALVPRRADGYSGWATKLPENVTASPAWIARHFGS